MLEHLQRAAEIIPLVLSFQNSIMPNYKLIYFNMRGRAEIIRYIFAYLDIKYEDHRIEQADWPAIKPSK